MNRSQPRVLFRPEIVIAPVPLIAGRLLERNGVILAGEQMVKIDVSRLGKIVAIRGHPPQNVGVLLLGRLITVRA